MHSFSLDVGDQVRIALEAHDHIGVKGYLAAIDHGNAYYVEPFGSDSWLGPFTRGELLPITHCEWFIRCTHEAVVTITHHILGDVPVCGSCLKFAQPDSYLD